MRVIAAVLLLAGLLAGCVGNFTNERIDARYEQCRATLLAEGSNAYALSVCDDNRKYDRDYRFSSRRFFGDITGGGSGTAPVPVIILK